MILLAIDPGTKISGGAVYQVEEKKLLHSKCFACSSKNPWDVRCVTLRRWIGDYAEQWKVDHMVIEFPAFERSDRGKSAAGTSSTVKLAYLVGRIVERVNRTTSLYTPHEWKLSKPKMVTNRYVCHLYPEQLHPYMDDNVLDACALGAWWVHGRPRSFIVP